MELALTCEPQLALPRAASSTTVAICGDRYTANSILDFLPKSTDSRSSSSELRPNLVPGAEAVVDHKALQALERDVRQQHGALKQLGGRQVSCVLLTMSRADSIT